jgi:hypothetical protein
MPAVQYNSIYCTSSSNCWAVGNSSGTTNILVRWNGTSWTQYNATNPIPSANFNSIACANPNDCWAVGATSGNTTAFIHYDGSTWSAVSPASMPTVPLNSVAFFGTGSTSWTMWYEKFS